MCTLDKNFAGELKMLVDNYEIGAGEAIINRVKAASWSDEREAFDEEAKDLTNKLVNDATGGELTIASADDLMNHVRICAALTSKCSL